MERRGRLQGDGAALIGDSNGVGWPVDIRVVAVKPGLAKDNVVLVVKADGVHVDGSMDDRAAGAVKTKVCGVGGRRAADGVAVAKSDGHAWDWLRWAWGGGYGLGGGCQTVEAVINEVGVGATIDEDSCWASGNPTAHYE